MLKPEFEMLSYIKASHVCTWADVLNTVRSKSEYDINALNAILMSCLKTKHWIKKTSAIDSPPSCSVRLTDAGECALLAELEDLRIACKETVAQRENQMRAVLRHVQANKSLDDLSFEEMRILKECRDAGYFEGVELVEMISGRVVAEYRHPPRLTLAGLQFLESGSSTDVRKKTSTNNKEQPDNAIKKVVYFLKRFIKRFWALFCGLSVFVTVFGWSHIEGAFSFLLSIFQ